MQIWSRSSGDRADEDPLPSGQKRNGDGYTRYEEYRGFAELLPDGKWRFVRTNPLKKDLFIHDPDGLSRKYFDPRNPVEMNLHHVDPRLFGFVPQKVSDPKHRWVNLNSEPEDWYARQFALVVRLDAKTDAKEAGYTRDWWLDEQIVREELSPGVLAVGEDYTRARRLKYYYAAEVHPAFIRATLRGLESKPALHARMLDAQLESTTIHEIGHALGIPHHGAGDERLKFCGTYTCPIRYLMDAEVADAEEVPRQVQFCRKGDARAANEVSYCGEEAPDQHDDCFGRIDVKSDP